MMANRGALSLIELLWEKKIKFFHVLVIFIICSRKVYMLCSIGSE